MNRSKTAHNLLDQICSELAVDMVLISEQYRSGEGPGWFSDTLGTAAIRIINPRRLLVAEHGSGCGYVWVRCDDVYYVSVYLSPSDRIGDFQTKLDGLEDAARDMRGNLIIAGDFNAKAIEWGENAPDSRGRQVMEMVARLGLVVLNTGSLSTFRRPGYRETIIDVSLANERLLPRVVGWKVIDDYTGSDHQYITFRVDDGRPAPLPRRVKPPPRWNIAKINEEAFSLALTRGQEAIDGIPGGLTPPARACRVVETTMQIIVRACKEAVPEKRVSGKRRPAYWWTKEIADLRKRCLYLRRQTQRTRGRGRDVAPVAAEHLAAKRTLKRAIIASQRRCWRELCEDLNKDPWGLGYKIVMRKLGSLSQRAPEDAMTVRTIVRTLFPTHPKRPGRAAPPGDPEVPLFTRKELLGSIKSMRNKKAPGPDGLPAEILKAVAGSHPELLLEMYNSCLTAGVFPARWKRARLALISKGKGPADAPSSFRPLCMLDTAGKLLEKLLRPRLQEAIRAGGDLSPRQYGFRPGLSTVNAIQEVVATARTTERGNHYSRPVCLLATLDVRNAFNSLRWDKVVEALGRFQIPVYLNNILENYLEDRALVYDTADGPEEIEVTAGAAQGSVLGAELWDAAYDGVLNIEMPEGVILVGYADDLAALIIARNAELCQMRLNQVMRRVSSWMEDNGLQLAKAKTELVFLTKKRINTLLPMLVGDTTVQTKHSVKYLGVVLDNKLTFGEHVRRAADKAAAVTTALSRVMANTIGPWQSKRRLLMRTAESIMLYGAEVWADALRCELYRKRMAAVQRRGALRVACSYRTVSEPAVLVIAGVIPIDLLAQERRFVYQTKVDLGLLPARRTARTNTILAWQQRWEQETRGRWTARLISQLDTWLDRREGEVNYYLTQLLSGHGLFRAYLYKMGKVDGPGCVLCGSPLDDARHTFFECERWSVERSGLQQALGVVTPDNIVRLMLRGIEEWAKVAVFAETVIRRKRHILDGGLP